jgi:hypothetical protein
MRWPWSRPSVTLDNPPPACAHRHWTIYARNLVGFGQCLDCQREVAIPDLFNELHTRLESSIERSERLEGRLELALYELEQKSRAK